MTMASKTRDRALGCFVGLFVGDALGAPVEFAKRGSFEPVTGYRDGGPFDLKAGQWTDDGSCALALADTLLAFNGQFNGADFLMRLAQWYQQGKYSSTGKCFDIGNQTRKAVVDYCREGHTVHGNSPRLQGNGSIMRLAPVALVADTEEQAVELGSAQSRSTHANSVCVKSCKSLAGVLWCEVQGKRCQSPGLLDIPRSKVKSSGHVVETLKAAAWCVERTDNFHDAVLMAANLGDDSDTVAAVTGQWAGARYGLTGIPVEWLQGLHANGRLVEVAGKLYNMRS